MHALQSDLSPDDHCDYDAHRARKFGHPAEEALGYNRQQ